MNAVSSEVIFSTGLHFFRYSPTTFLVSWTQASSQPEGSGTPDKTSRTCVALKQKREFHKELVYHLMYNLWALCMFQLLSCNIMNLYMRMSLPLDMFYTETALYRDSFRIFIWACPSPLAGCLPDVLTNYRISLMYLKCKILIAKKHNVICGIL